MNELRASDVATATRLAAVVGGLVALTALAVHLLAAGDAREWLGFTFPGLEGTLDEAGAILVNNLRLLGAVLVACIVAQIARPGASAGRIERAALLCVVGVCDLVLVAGCALHVVFVGSALGAYGGRTLDALLPHGPVELGAFSLGLALYLAARREPLAPRRLIDTGSACALGLLVAALLEVLA